MSELSRWLIGLLSALVMLEGQWCAASEAAGDALTLQSVLSAPLDRQYGVMSAAADILEAKANRALVDSWYDPTVSIQGHLRYIQPSRVATDPNTREDNAIGISARQRLYDFGRQAMREGAAKQQVISA
ncbi:MAG: TolC family protein, partial [Halothiobacillus sp.]